MRRPGGLRNEPPIEQCPVPVSTVDVNQLPSTHATRFPPTWAGCPKGQFGARDLQKHLWKLPIPEFDPDNPLHAELSAAGEAASEGAAQQLARLREERDRVTVTIARRELRKWLRASPEGQAVEDAVRKLL